MNPMVKRIVAIAAFLVVASQAVSLGTAAFPAVLPAVAALAAEKAAGGGSGDASGIKIEVGHLVMKFGDGDTVWVSDVTRLVRGSSKDGPGAVGDVLVPVFPGYSDLTPQAGIDAGAMVQEKDVLRVPAVFAEDGSMQVVFSYTLSKQALSAGLTRKVLYPTDQLLFLTEPGILLSSEALEGGGAMDATGSAFREYHAENLKAGSQFQVSASFLGGAAGGDSGAGGVQEGSGDREAANQEDRPVQGGQGQQPLRLIKTAFHGGSANVMLWMRLTGSPNHGGLPGIVAIGLVLGLLIFGGVALTRRRTPSSGGRDRGMAAKPTTASGAGRGSASGAGVSPVRVRAGAGVSARASADTVVSAGIGDPAGVTSSKEELLQEKARLMGDLVNLEKRFRRGELAEPQYTALRGEQKRALLDVMLQLKKAGQLGGPQEVAAAGEETADYPG